LAPVDKPEKPCGIEALTTPVICRPANAVDFFPAKWSHLQDIKFPEDFPRSEEQIGVLIGLDLYYSFVTRDIVKGGPNEPVAVRTSLGWVFCGQTSHSRQECSVSMNVQVCSGGVAPQLLTTSNFIGPWYHPALLFSGLGSIVLLFGVLFSQQIREDLVRAATSP